MKILAVIVTLKAGYTDLEIAGFPLKEPEIADKDSAAVAKCKIPPLGPNTIITPHHIYKKVSENYR